MLVRPNTWRLIAPFDTSDWSLSVAPPVAALAFSALRLPFWPRMVDALPSGLVLVLAVSCVMLVLAKLLLRCVCCVKGLVQEVRNLVRRGMSKTGRVGGQGGYLTAVAS